MFAFDIECPEEAVGPSLLCGFVCPCQHIHVAGDEEIRAHLMVGLARLPHGFGIVNLPLKEERKSCQMVEEKAAPHDAVQLLVGQVLVEHQQVVAEVEEGLAGVLAF